MALWCCALPAIAEIKLPSIIGDNMVLQRDHELKFWGLADPKEYVTVVIGEQKYGTVADGKGRWLVKFPPQKNEPSEVTIKGKNVITLKNILWGDVWLTAGESNMAMTVDQCAHSQDDLERANLPEIRLFKVEPRCTKGPEFDLDPPGKWVVCSPSSIGSFSSVAYFFGLELYEKVHVPLGLIETARNAGKVHSWISAESMEKNQEFKGLPGLHDEHFAFLQQMIDALAETDQAEEPAKFNGLQHKVRLFLENTQTATCNFNGMISPVVPFTLRGVLLYQGENDLGEPLRYSRLFNLLVQDWRAQFMQPNLPFVCVQMPNIGVRSKEPEESQYADLREAQSSFRKIPYFYFAVTIDTVPGDNAPPRPKDKRQLAHRAALLALATQYHLPVKCFSPFYDDMEIMGDKIKIHFSLAEPELKTKGKEVYGFTIAGDDRQFVNAKAKVDGDSVLVWSDQVKKPLAVRYEWADNPACSLYSQDDLPVCPFRTDTWPRQKKGSGESAPSKSTK